MSKSVFLIPAGPKNLKSLFPGVDFSRVSDYYLEIKNTGNTVVATTPVYKCNCCCTDDKIRIHFLNYLGTYDAVNFRKPAIEHDDTSAQYKNGLSYPLQKTDTGTERFNVSSNDIHTALLKCKEADMPWLQELADSPKMFLEWTGIEGQADDYIPIIKKDGKFDKLKNQEEFDYEFILEFELSNDYFAIRN